MRGHLINSGFAARILPYRTQSVKRSPGIPWKGNPCQICWIFPQALVNKKYQLGNLEFEWTTSA
jgi:hypothetical protein